MLSCLRWFRLFCLFVVLPAALGCFVGLSALSLLLFGGEGSSRGKIEEPRFACFFRGSRTRENNVHCERTDPIEAKQGAKTGGVLVK